LATKTLYLVHPIWDEKVEDVKAKMRILGAPTVRVVDLGDCYMAIEGCHRLMAAAELGIAPVLIVLTEHDLIEVDTIDTDYFKPGEIKTAGEIARAYRHCHNVPMALNENGTLTPIPAPISEED
jgi:hypothetical protein